MFKSYEVGTRCWAASKELGWVGATVTARRVVNDNECELDLELESSDNGGGTQLTMKISGDPSPDLPLRNPPILEATSETGRASWREGV